MKGKFVLGIIILLSLAFVSCVSRRTPATGQANLSQARGQETAQGWNIPEYRLRRGDEIEIKFFYNPSLNERLIVRPDGNISLQLIDELYVAGLTPAQLDKTLTKRYATEIKNPELTVIVRSFAGERVYVGGEVATPQLIPLTGRLTVLESIFRAGGFKDSAKLSSVIVIRKDAENHPFGIKADLNGVIKGEEGARDIELRPFDVVYVPKKNIAKVNVWVDQWLRKNIPVTMGFGFTYELGTL